MTRAQAAKADLFFWLQALVIALVVLILLFTFVGRIITVDGSSMLPTLHHKDVLLLRTVAYTPEQGDVVVLTKDFSGEYYQLPEGQEDVHLTGKNTFNPFAGNPFRFENNESEGIKGHRRKAIAIGLIPVVLLCVSVVALICAFCAPSDSPAGDPTEGPSNGPKTFEQEGMRITLTEQFHSVSVPKFTVGYESDEVVVLALREEFSDVPALKIYDLKQYAELVLMANSIYGSDPRETDGLTLFEYDYTDRKTMVRYHYVCFVFKTEDSFWTVQFVTEKDKEYDYKWKFFQWAKTVTFE